MPNSDPEISRANKKRPQPGEDGYGRLVRAQQGRGGDDSSHALELRDNADWRPEFRAQRLVSGQDIGAHVQRDRRAQFALGKFLA